VFLLQLRLSITKPIRFAFTITDVSFHYLFLIATHRFCENSRVLYFNHAFFVIPVTFPFLKVKIRVFLPGDVSQQTNLIAS